MRSASVRVSVVLSAALLASVLLGSNVLAQSVSLAVQSQFSPNPVPVCVQSNAVLGVSWTAPPPAPYPCTGWTSPSWTWSITGPAGVSISSFNNTTATVSASICTPGTCTITVTATATWHDSCGNPASASGSITLDSLTVVAVTSITPLSEIYTTKNLGDTLTKADFSITTNPPGYDSLVTVAPVTIQIGDNNVTATCGCSTATTDVIGCQRSGSWSDLLVGPSDSDDTANFTALIQGCAGEYLVTGSSPNAIIDSGDTSGSLIKDQSHTGTVYVSATPPDDSGSSRLPILLNGSLAYGLGGIAGSAQIKQINGDGGLTIGILALIAAVGGTGTAAYGLSLDWSDPQVTPSGTVPVSVQAQVQNYNPTTVNSTFTMSASGRARSSAFGYKYTWQAAETLNIQAPNPLTVTNTNTKQVESGVTYASVTMIVNDIGKNPSQSNSNVKAGSSASASLPGKSQTLHGNGNAQLWIGDLNVTDQNWSKSNKSINVVWYPE